MLIKSKYGIISMVMMMMVMSSSDISLSSDLKFSEFSKIDFFRPVIDKLIIAGVDSNFIYKTINHPSTEFNERFVRINVIGYLKPPDYSGHYSDKSVSQTKDFLQTNIGLLELAEQRYGVPKEVISSVLWVETRHGTFLGNSHVASVYLSTAMCNEKSYLDMNIRNLKDKFTGSLSEFEELEKKVYLRAKKKSDWAIEQLIALSNIDNRALSNVLDLKGSWAGAFGISQFIPSSYLSWAVDGNNDGVVDLFNLNDAIFSVGNYLKCNGWGVDETQMREAVYHYNNSNAYVDAVLKLASLVKEVPNPTNSLAPLEEIRMQAQSGGDDF